MEKLLAAGIGAFVSAVILYSFAQYFLTHPELFEPVKEAVRMTLP